MNILCTICARGGSKGVANKALRKINGKHLIEITIKQALSSKVFDEIVVSTDSKKIQNIANKNGAKSWFLRSKNLSNDYAPKIPSIRDALLKSEIKFKKKFDICIDLDVTSPLRNVKDIKDALKLFLKKKQTENLFSVSEARKNPYYNMVEIKNKKVSLIKKLDKKNYFNRRQSAPKVFDMNASIYIWKRSRLIRSDKLFSRNTDIYIMPQSRSIDIDSYFDLNLIKYFFKNRHV
tara:strand:+ start:88 stop:792 length:705 start_codon:yes stop_codon:yes gene_type:complete